MSKKRSAHIIPTLTNTAYLYSKTPTSPGEGSRRERRWRAKTETK